MCGIAGYVTRSDAERGPAGPRPAERIEWMTSTLRHRGPDDAGLWRDDAAGLALGHARLSILDLSPEGHQPMASPGERFRMSFNGEIYNYRDLRGELEACGFSFRGGSDTEVMLAAFERWGVDGAVRRFVGMFAFAAWDRRERTLTLARDRFGEKPLYYGWSGAALLFASELKALRAYPGWSNDVDRDALALLMRHGYVPAPYSIYRNVRKLEPGHTLTLAVDALRPGDFGEPVAYWSARDVAEGGIAEPFEGTDAEAIDALERVLGEAVGRQMVADVPLGAFLSGGIDSSTVVALMRARSPRPVRTFTIGFDDRAFDEAVHARAIARHLGTEHTELVVTPDDALAVIPKLATIYDEPFSDSSQIPTYLVSKLARERVTVCLSGDGGDELFCGYKRYGLADRMWRRTSWVPASVRRLAARGVRSAPASAWDRAFGWADAFTYRLGRPGPIGDKLYKAAELLEAREPDAMYRRIVSHWRDTDALVPMSRELATPYSVLSSNGGLGDFTHRMMLADTVAYLPDDILVKVDRASMAVSLESRLPFLDHRVMDLAWRLPMSAKVRGGKGKWVLREVLARHVPRALFEREKQGFSVPIDAWLVGPLREWAESLLDERRLRAEGFFDPAPIRRRWHEHVRGDHKWHYCLWNVLMFQQWLEEQRALAA